VGEEVGLGIDHVHYFGSQPWPFPRSLMVAFTAHVAHPEALHIDEREIVRADWFTRDEVRAAWAKGSIEAPPPMSIAHSLILAWLGDL
jgi:NAD+ diphosphatase